jgi:hypothetical protein
MSSKKTVTEKKASAKKAPTTSIESAAITQAPQERACSPYPGFIDQWEHLTWGYDRIVAILDHVFVNMPECDEENDPFCAMQALKQQNREHKALWKKGWDWFGNPETRKFFGRLTYDELVAENARKQAEQAGEHPIQ